MNIRFRNLGIDTQTIIVNLLEDRAAHAAQSKKLHTHFQNLSAIQKAEYARTREAFVQEDVKKRKTELCLLESVRFPELRHRVEGIAEAHEKTFGWIFRDPKAHQKPWNNFIEWLSNGSGTYWIQGKAASGKSTLMKFICNHHSTSQNLLLWRHSSHLQVINAAFFFWNSGIQEQRSHSGLLRSLLYEVLCKATDLITDVLPDELERTGMLEAHDFHLTPVKWSFD